LAFIAKTSFNSPLAKRRQKVLRVREFHRGAVGALTVRGCAAFGNGCRTGWTALRASVPYGDPGGPFASPSCRLIL